MANNFSYMQSVPDLILKDTDVGIGMVTYTYTEIKLKQKIYVTLVELS